MHCTATACLSFRGLQRDTVKADAALVQTGEVVARH